MKSFDDPQYKAYNPTAIESAWYAWWEKGGISYARIHRRWQGQARGILRHCRAAAEYYWQPSHGSRLAMLDRM